MLVLVLLTGCSVALVRGPRASAPDQDPACTRSPIGPALDVILAGVSGGVALVFQQRHEDYKPDPDPLPGNIAEGDHNPEVRNAAIVVGLIGLASAAYGFVQLSRCQRAYNAYWRQAGQ